MASLPEDESRLFLSQVQECPALPRSLPDRLDQREEGYRLGNHAFGVQPRFFQQGQVFAQVLLADGEDQRSLFVRILTWRTKIHDDLVGGIGEERLRFELDHLLLLLPVRERQGNPVDHGLVGRKSTDEPFSPFIQPGKDFPQFGQDLSPEVSLFHLRKGQQGVPFHPEAPQGAGRLPPL